MWRTRGNLFSPHFFFPFLCPRPTHTDTLLLRVCDRIQDTSSTLPESFSRLNYRTWVCKDISQMQQQQHTRRVTPSSSSSFSSFSTFPVKGAEARFTYESWPRLIIIHGPLLLDGSSSSLCLSPPLLLFVSQFGNSCARVCFGVSRPHANVYQHTHTQKPATRTGCGSSTIKPPPSTTPFQGMDTPEPDGSNPHWFRNYSFPNRTKEAQFP